MAKKRIEETSTDESVQPQMLLSLDSFIDASPKTKSVTTKSAFKFWVHKVKKVDVLEKKSSSEWDELLDTFLKEKV